MNYSFHPLAEIELNEAIDYYNERQLDLGKESKSKFLLSMGGKLFLFSAPSKSAPHDSSFRGK